ncbi:hypothetical protein MSAN_02023800 [Mycena sanguinolenta]|uniref:CxC5 like cysteine cluster associated with KDZ domain-containing protein n=1 Tax=Mycena sanguinolenta TaxID=230812 RepID=A0A8H6XLM4_9AGAR|nr:hypothetical protein MSAN_02023800 [Mycena sanguinolenta]
MGPTVRDLILILQIFFPADLDLRQALYLFSVIFSVYPLLRLHLNQRRQPGQRTHGAWFNSIRSLFRNALKQEDDAASIWGAGNDRSAEYAEYISNDLGALYQLLGLNPHLLENPNPDDIFPAQRIVLCTPRLSCTFCPPGDLNIIPTLRRRTKPQVVWILGENLRWMQGDVIIAHCSSCGADFYPDSITFRDAQNRRRQKLESSPTYIRVSKAGIWVHRRVAVLQESALNRFHAGWSNFADSLNDVTGTSQRKFTYRQSQRLWVEHFARRLLLFHNQIETFSCKAHPSTSSLSEAVRSTIGVDGGVLPCAMTHGCTECTHLKRFRSDLIAEGAVFGREYEVVGIANEPVLPDINDPVAAQLGTPQQQELPPDGLPRGYIRLAVMDGKNIPHQKCALQICERPLVNYRDGRFCEVHLELAEKCGIVSCGQPVREVGALTCDNQTHVEWYRQYKNRFTRLSFPGVQRVIRRQQERGTANPSAPTLHVELNPLGDLPGNEVVHTFKAGSTYCLQTIQWACGHPIGWGKCYRSESSSQVLSIINRIWADYPAAKPGFIAYDDACSLLRHIVTQDSHDPWLQSTKFVVDAWHYIGHLATDALCRLWCNPQPTNGSQPDLIRVELDINGTAHQTRAFNTETAEQLNSWLNGFESQLRHMSATNYDFFIHALMMLYAERIEKRVEEKNLGLTEEFWAEALGNNADSEL